jgi:site-specific DNA-methyltransferase (adenine-specific)
VQVTAAECVTTEADLSPWLGRVTCGDCLELLRGLPANSVDSIITDPPAGISFMGKAWDGDKGGRRQWIAWLAEILAECYRVAKPGATLLCWALPRTSHWTGSAIEDGGWEVADCVVHHFGTGFPKSLDIGKAIDKAAGAEREVVGANPCYRPNKANHANAIMRPVSPGEAEVISAPATDLAREWDGWGTALKPSFEPIIVAMKPCDGTFAANAAKWGVAGLNVDGCRVGISEDLPTYTVGAHQGGGASVNPYFTRENQQARADAGENPRYSPSGRWPPNTLLSHSPGCGPEGCVEGCPVRILGEQSGEAGWHGGAFHQSHCDLTGKVYGGGSKALKNELFRADTGTAARFFPQFEAEPGFLYCAKAGRREREAGCEGLGEASKAVQYGDGLNSATKVRTDEQAADGVDRGGTRNPHPCVKPQALMEWLCRLTATPTGGVVLDPFSGSGTTGVACANTGREFIGFELDESYATIANARIAHAQAEAASRLPLEAATGGRVP